jgi:hypothetical protein
MASVKCKWSKRDAHTMNLKTTISMKKAIWMMHPEKTTFLTTKRAGAGRRA